MPLYIPQTNPTAAGLHSILRAMAKLAPPDAKPSIMVFYSSPGDDGKMWCPHCVNIEPVITKIFGDEAPEAPQATVIYVGDRATWENPDNPWRAPPFSISGVPTILKYEKEELKTFDQEENDVPLEEQVRQFIKPSTPA